MSLAPEICRLSPPKLFATFILSKLSNISVTLSGIAIFFHGRAESSATRRNENKTAKRQRGSAVRRTVLDYEIERRTTDEQAAKKAT